MDEVLRGGLIPGRAYLVRGGPGTGKTTLGLQFLAAGASNGESVLFVTLSEPESQIKRNAERLGIRTEGIYFLDLSPTPDFFVRVETYDLFSPAEVEREPITRKIVQIVEALRPRRVFIDSMTQFRYLSTDPFQYRKQVLSFIRFLIENGGTVLFSSEASPEAPDEDLQFLADGVIELERTAYGRFLQISKFRGSDFLPGQHSIKFGKGGIEVFPAIVPPPQRQEFRPEQLSSGVEELDNLLGGGIERGTTTVITGPSGVGKTTLGLLFIHEAAKRGEISALWSFEEDIETISARAEKIGIPIRQMIGEKKLHLIKVEPLLFTAEEFAHTVRQYVKEGVRIVMIDSVEGYVLSLRGKDLQAHLHALCKSLTSLGVIVFLINEVEHITGEFRPTEKGLSYLADNLIFLRYFEAKGELRRAMGVLKKRLSDFEKAMREFWITAEGVKVGPPLTKMRGILSGIPELEEHEN